MIWLTWRQFRTQAVVALAALAAFAAVLTVTGRQLADLYASSGLASCHTECDRLADAFLSQAKNGTTGTVYYIGIGVVFVVPAVIGVFWGAPLIARELEAGTHRLAWNQSVTRGRWLPSCSGWVLPAWLPPACSASWSRGGPARSTRSACTG